ncbi:hypothetical protein [Isoptericola croceus]|nr:hypothetical protein [Isoptericola croceus]
MEDLTAITVIVSATAALFHAVGHFVIRLLPLVSNRVNRRAVRLARAQRK